MQSQHPGWQVMADGPGLATACDQSYPCFRPGLPTGVGHQVNVTCVLRGCRAGTLEKSRAAWPDSSSTSQGLTSCLLFLHAVNWVIWDSELLGALSSWEPWVYLASGKVPRRLLTGPCRRCDRVTVLECV